MKTNDISYFCKDIYKDVNLVCMPLPLWLSSIKSAPLCFSVMFFCDISSLIYGDTFSYANVFSYFPFYFHIQESFKVWLCLLNDNFLFQHVNQNRLIIYNSANSFQKSVSR